MADTSRGSDNTLAGAIKRFQAKAGLTLDGQITPSLLAMLRATKTQVAALQVTPNPGKNRRLHRRLPGLGTATPYHTLPLRTVELSTSVAVAPAAVSEAKGQAKCHRVVDGYR
jgi:peptidoglycan hydrolase-like protein with peptidoglycan-binding domain